MDNVSKGKRSDIMRAIRSRNSQIENFLRRELHKRKYHFKTNVESLPGKPDIVFARKKLAIFIDSCFWHGCKLHCRLPQTNRRYWEPKIARNRMRDKEVNTLLKKSGWKALRFWEHQIHKNPDKILKKLKGEIQSRN